MTITADSVIVRSVYTHTYCILSWYDVTVLLEWSREKLLEAWIDDPVACCEESGVDPPHAVYERFVRHHSYQTSRDDDDNDNCRAGLGGTQSHELSTPLPQVSSTSDVMVSAVMLHSGKCLNVTTNSFAAATGLV